jgi:hypothetical protein
LLIQGFGTITFLPGIEGDLQDIAGLSGIGLRGQLPAATAKSEGQRESWQNRSNDV